MSILPLPGVMRIRATDVLRRPVAMNFCVCAIKFSSGEFDRMWLLRGVRMGIAAINFQFAINRAAQPIVRDHSTHCPLNQQFRMTRAPGAGVLRFVTAYVARET